MPAAHRGLNAIAAPGQSASQGKERQRPHSAEREPTLQQSHSQPGSDRQMPILLPPYDSGYRAPPPRTDAEIAEADVFFETFRLPA